MVESIVHLILLTYIVIVFRASGCHPLVMRTTTTTYCYNAPRILFQLETSHRPFVLSFVYRAWSSSNLYIIASDSWWIFFCPFFFTFQRTLSPSCDHEL